MRKIFLVLIVLAVLAGAGALVIRHRANNEGFIVTPGTATTSPSLYTSGTYKESLVTADGRTRDYLLHVPIGYSSAKSYPLVMLFHGGYGGYKQVMKQTNFAAKADSEGFVVVSPDGIDGHWNDGAHNPDIDDVAFMRQLLSSVEAKLSVDSKRIYATGISNGGHFTQRVACGMPGVFAAIGTDVAPLSENMLQICSFLPIPIIGIQGGADPLTPIAGGDGKGEGGILLSAVATMQKWAEINECKPTATLTQIPPTVSDGTSVDKYTFSGCKADVVYYIVQGMGHGWPPTPATIERISGKTSQNINATDVVWDFFAAHPKF